MTSWALPLLLLALTVLCVAWAIESTPATDDGGEP